MIDCDLCYPGECTPASHAAAEAAVYVASTCTICGATPGSACDFDFHRKERARRTTLALFMIDGSTGDVRVLIAPALGSPGDVDDSLHQVETWCDSYMSAETSDPRTVTVEQLTAIIELGSDLDEKDPGSWKPLQVQRERIYPPQPQLNDAVNYVALWNAIAPAGTRIRFFPTWGSWDCSREDVIAQKASVNSSGCPVLWLEKTTGCVSAYHCEPLYPEGAT